MSGTGARLSLFWVRVYTRGADVEAGARRAAELASDIWEHEHHALTEGRTPSAIDSEILFRCLRGVPADVSWRFRHRSTGGIGVMHTISRNALAVVSALLAAWFFVLGVGINFGESTSSVWWSMALFASGIAVLTGLWLMRRSPWLGCTVLAVGALPLGAITFWMIFPPVLALGAVGLAVTRARTQTRQASQPLPA